MKSIIWKIVKSHVYRVENGEEDSEIAANFAALNQYSAPLRKSNPDIPETIAEDE